MKASIIIRSNKERMSGFRYFWAKRVTGFNHAVHCARCLHGSYISAVSARMTPNVETALNGIKHGDVVYICGVSNPYRWGNNFHFAGRIVGGDDKVSFLLWQGDEIVITGIEQIPFDDRAARLRYPHKGKEFLTCRNFQFGAQMYG